MGKTRVQLDLSASESKREREKCVWIVRRSDPYTSLSQDMAFEKKRNGGQFNCLQLSCVCVNPSSFLFIRFFLFCTFFFWGRKQQKKGELKRKFLSFFLFFYFLYSSLYYYNSKRDPTKWRMINSPFFFSIFYSSSLFFLGFVSF